MFRVQGFGFRVFGLGLWRWAVGFIKRGLVGIRGVTDHCRRDRVGELKQTCQGTSSGRIYQHDPLDPVFREAIYASSRYIPLKELLPFS